MATPTVKRAKFVDILNATKAHLVKTLGIAGHRIKLSARDSLPPFSGSQDLILRPRNPTPAPEWESGAGRVATVFQRPLGVIIRTRLSTDTSDDDSQWLTNTSLGHFQMEEKVVDALQMWFPEDSRGNHLVIQPLRMIPSPPVEKDQPETGWGRSDLEFLILYAVDLDQSIQ